MNHTEPSPGPGPQVIPRSEHGVSRAKISDSALKVLYRLRNSGYAAFIVGGGVRDLLIGLDPKDFDVVTDASPDEVRELFRNSRLIGRRFRLAHVRFGREIIEVATFRAGSDIEAGDSDREHHAESGRILRDNVYGAIDEDIWRRDFTVNALYYNIADFSIWDYTSGMEDVRTRTLRLIGDPVTRYREDPVRMLRAVRLAAKLDFTIAPEAAAPIADLGDLLRDVPSARLFEEVLKLFQSGHALKSYEMLRHYGLFRFLFPLTAEVLDSPKGAEADIFIRKGLENTDARIAAGKSTTPLFLYAVLLWHPVQALADEVLEEGGRTPYQAMLEAASRILGEQQGYTSLPRRFSSPTREVMQLQQRFGNRKGARAARFLEHKRFRAAYDFMLLRAECGEVDAETAEWWTAIQERPEHEKKQELGLGKRRSGGRRRGGRRRRRREASDSAT